MPDYKHVRYQRPVKDLNHELDKKAEGPDMQAILEFEAVLERLFQQTQRDVHAVGLSPSGRYVRTGSLKASGKRAATHPRGRWIARITYGGTSPGINNPVKYAVYEQENEETGESLSETPHNFMAGIEDTYHDQEWERAIRDWLRGQR